MNKNKKVLKTLKNYKHQKYVFKKPVTCRYIRIKPSKVVEKYISSPYDSSIARFDANLGLDTDRITQSQISSRSGDVIVNEKRGEVTLQSNLYDIYIRGLDIYVNIFSGQTVTIIDEYLVPSEDNKKMYTIKANIKHSLKISSIKSGHKYIIEDISNTPQQIWKKLMSKEEYDQLLLDNSTNKLTNNMEFTAIIDGNKADDVDQTPIES